MSANKPHHQYSYTATCNGLAEPGTINTEHPVTEETRIELESDIKTLVMRKFGPYTQADEINVSFEYVGVVV